MTQEEAINALVQFDPNRSYCVETLAWAHVSCLHGHPPSLVDQFFICIIPGVRNQACTRVEGETMEQAIASALGMLRNEQVSAEKVREQLAA